MLVVWSGGLDSTLILADLLRKDYHARIDEPGQEQEFVRSISVNHPQVSASRILRRTRKNLLDEFKRRGWKLYHNEITIKHEGKYQAGSCDFSLQPLLWLGTVFPYIWKTEKLMLGYLLTDSASKENMVSTFNSMRQVVGKEASIEFPLQYESKHEVIHRMREHKLFDLCFWCEQPKRDQACGNCNPCRTNLTAQWHLKQWPIKKI